ncbi:hypothetical protein ACFE04_015170 [Oxalis oulophora]
MANSKYEYVKSFEFEDEIMLPNIIIVKIDGCDFNRFSEVHEFEKPNDDKALELMNKCAVSVMQRYPDIVFAYGYSDEYSFVFKKTTKFYQRRASKVLSVIVSSFASIYVDKFKEVFSCKDLKYAPSFRAKVVCCATLEVFQAYLAWRQNDCHTNNQHDICFWMLCKSGKSESEAREILKGTQKQEKNEILFQQFGINYKTLPAIFRQGSCLFKSQVEYVVKFSEDGTPIKRLRRKENIVHAENIAARRFWNEHSSLLTELGGFAEDLCKTKPEYIRSFLFENKLMPLTYILVRIDGCHFHRFSDDHKFEKPNDEQALMLMNSCAISILEKIEDVVFAYGISDEYSFVLKKGSQFCQRKASEIVSVIVSHFSSTYVMRWKDFFPTKTLKYSPCFDGRAVCYPSYEIIRDYLSWRQVDCHINNQYNSCFWALVKSGKSKSEAQKYLKGTQSQEKNDLLLQFGIDYNTVKDIFRHGSSVFRIKEKRTADENVESAVKLRSKVKLAHNNIIDDSFWDEHPWILLNEE